MDRKDANNKKSNDLTLWDVLFGTDTGLFEDKKKKNKDNDELMPWERREVNKGNYDPSNFEEEDLEDDDYYSDDLD